MSAGISSRRAHERKDLCVMGAIASASLSAIVRIRNLSERGALIEGAELPEAGERINLRRGDLIASGVVVRKAGTKVGLEFEQPIHVSAWLSSPVRDHSYVQMQVGRALASNSDRYDHSGPTSLSPTVSTTEELLGIAQMLTSLADALSEHPDIISRYYSRLQVLDIAAQKLCYFAQN